MKITTKREKLTATTWVLGDTKVIKSLLWCDRVPKGKRNKPSKINGVMYNEIVDDVVAHSYYQPLN